MTAPPSISIVIPSHNRREDLLHTCRQLSALVPPPEAILIGLDNCTDGSAMAICEEFPNVLLWEVTPQRGSVELRDTLFRRVASEIILSLDDDSYPLQADALQRIADAFAAHPEAGVLTFSEIRNNGQSPDARMSVTAEGHYVPTYPGCAAAIRRSIYGTDASYCGFFFHNYEEPDFCVQCYGAGYAVWFEPTIRIRHHFSPVARNLLRTQRQNARNELLSVVRFCPAPYVIPVGAYRIFRQLLFAATQGWAWLRQQPEWWWDFYVLLPKARASRRPVTWMAYWSWMCLNYRRWNNPTDIAAAFPRREV